MDYLESATQNYKSHYNCAQSILCAYSNLLGIDEKTAFKLSEGFGGGMGMKETCGAVTAMFAVLSYLKSDGLLSEGKSKRDNYKLMNMAAEQFKSMHGSLLCRELKSSESYHSCLELIQSAVKIIENLKSTN